MFCTFVFVKALSFIQLKNLLIDLFCSILFYSILFYSILFYSILFYWTILLHSSKNVHVHDQSTCIFVCLQLVRYDWNLSIWPSSKCDWYVTVHYKFQDKSTILKSDVRDRCPCHVNKSLKAKVSVELKNARNSKIAIKRSFHFLPEL